MKQLLFLVSVFLFSTSCQAQTNVVLNGSFESELANWQYTTNWSWFTANPCVGSYYAMTATGAGNGVDALNDDLYQTVQIPTCAQSATLSFCSKTLSSNSNPTNDYMQVYFGGTAVGGAIYAQASTNYTTYTISIPNISSYSGQGAMLKFHAYAPADGYWSKFYLDNVSLEVTVGTSPATPSISSGNGSICSGNSATLTASPSCSGCIYNWSNYGSTGSNNSVTVNPSGTTSYTVSASNGCGTVTSNSYTVTVTNVQTPDISENPQSPSCGPIQLNANSSGCNSCTYSWSGGNANGAITTISNTGTNAYTVTATSNNCTATASTSVTINANPTAMAGGNSPICTGATLNLTSSGGNTYSWNGPNFSSSQQNPDVSNIQVSDAGAYTVTVTGTGGCTATATVNVNVTQTPTVSITPTSASLCNGGSQVLTASSGASSYSWSVGGTNAQITVSPTSTTTYTITASNGNCSITAASTITVSPSASPAAISPPSANVNCSDSGVVLTVSPSGSSYSWAGPGNFSSSAASISVSNSGTYTVTITDAGGCSVSETASATVTCITAIEEIEAIRDLAIVPNPSSGAFIMSFSANQTEQILIKVFDATGREVWNEDLGKIAGSISKQLHLTNTSAGEYIVQITAGAQVVNRKITITQ